VNIATPKEEFLRTVRRALGKDIPSSGVQMAHSDEDRKSRAAEIKDLLAKGRPELLGVMADVAARMGWKVYRVGSHLEAAERVKALAQKKSVKAALHSSHPVLEKMGLAAALPGVEMTPMSASNDAEWTALREKAAAADMGITGADYAVAETASCVFIARPGQSRMTSLLPPLHVAVIELGQVLASLDELFALLAAGHVPFNYLNMVSGPSRTGDIEQTIVIGAHGPKEAHMVIIG